jgi:REP element-mobilizing transposase RayT
MVILHLVFGTKNRHPWIREDLQPKLHAFLAESCRKAGSHAFRVGGTENHVHIACSLPRTIAIAKLLEDIKKFSSSWIKKQDPDCRNFAWQTGYGAFSVGKSQLPALIHYIDRQKEHHQKRNFRAEYIELLEKYGIEYDTDDLWE